MIQFQQHIYYSQIHKIHNILHLFKNLMIFLEGILLNKEFHISIYLIIYG